MGEEEEMNRKKRRKEKEAEIRKLPIIITCHVTKMHKNNS